jgi:polar amino acid transport system substrate-binding protein
MAMDDAANIRKVGVGRIDAAVIDTNVFNYLLKNDPSLAFVKSKVRMNPRLLEAKSLHVAFTNSDYGRKMAAVFAEGLKKVDVKTMQASLIHTSFTE